MKRSVVSAVITTGLLLAGPVIAGQGSTTVKGEVVRVEQMTRTAEGGPLSVATIRTRNGEQVKVNLGPAGGCEGCVQPGDQVRVRTMASDPSGELRQVRSMKVRREGQMSEYRMSQGRLVQSRGRARDGGAGTAGARDQDRTRDRDRIHTPDTGKGSRGGGRRGGR